ncbi:MAG TPA: L,D-transpeptidase [Candidatus Sulfotelmatobacter sp.]|nr:L,D-transpeptidase [Candidatus Sulfotelmatobacter sp.]
MTRVTGWLFAAIILVLVNPLVAQTSQVSRPPRVQRTVLVSLPDRKLAVLENGAVLADFPVSVGADENPSPTGEFKVVNRVSNPIYYHQGAVIPAGKSNPVGTRWIGLSEKGYGIHGTNVPKSIGRAASHGCIRLQNRDMEKLFGMLRVGDVVEIRGERDEKVAAIFGGQVDEESEVVAEVGSEAGQAASSF